MNPADLAALVPSWEIHLRAERKTEGTIKTYLDGVRPFLRWCADHNHDPLRTETLKVWTAELIDTGRSAATAKTRMQAVRHFSRWLADEGEIDADPFERVRTPKVDQPVVPVLSEDQLRALFKACEPPATERTGLASLRHRRDEAIVRLLAETGMRASECINLEVDDLDMREGEVVIRRGKGRKAGFGAQTAKALDRYQRIRRLHRLADGPHLWLGDRGKTLAYNGLYWTLGERAKAAGITHFHPHMIRHTTTDRWLAAGGSEIGVMATLGWSSPAMLQRYGRANREKRAMDEARKLNLGDL